ncbi:eukaryotic translation initiation factor 4 gamma 2-like [Watersipora subatra]|uniref:eukaryotic translation initiation factor 4 gamma 2-like n=1 Tax=Watersipora subatra TaxID=2589382 RepID=UPI00355C969D
MSRNFQLWSETRSILDALGQVEGISSTRHKGIGYSQDALFSQPAQVLSTPTDRSKAWVAPSTKRKQAAASRDQHLNDAPPLTSGSVFHRARGILNKLTPERFDKLSLELLNVGIDSEVTLRGLIILIFDKAVDEPKFSSLYAQLCERLSKDAPNFEPSHRKINTFYKLLLTKCQDEFESRAKITSDSTNFDFKTEEEWEEFANTKRKMLGNIRFIGELGKLEVVNEGILHKCIQQLLEKKRTLSLADQAEDLECLCQIMKTVGKRLDTPKAKMWMDQYFERMAGVQASADMPSRIRFMVENVIEMRDNGWAPRKVATELTPQTIGEIRQAFPHMRVDNNSMFGRTPSSAAKNTDADLYDIFGAPMASKASGLTPSLKGDLFRPASPSSRHGYSRPDAGWSDGIDKEKADWEGYRDREQMRELGREKPDYGSIGAGKSRDTQSRYNNKSLSLTAGDKLSLRPGASLRPSFKPSSPHHLPKSARSNNSFSSEPVMREPRIYTKPQTPVIIKQEPKQKAKKQSEQKSGDGSAGVSGQLLSSCSSLWTSSNVEETCADISSLLKKSGAKTIQTKTIRQIIKQGFDEAGTGCLPRLVDLLSLMLNGSYLDLAAIEKILFDLVDEIERKEAKYPDVKSMTAELLCAAVDKELITLSAVCKQFLWGTGHPLALQFLKLMLAIKGEQWISAAFTKHNISCISMLPASSQTDSEALMVLEEYGLLSLEPMLSIQRLLWQQIQDDPSPASLFKWILRNVEECHQTKNEFAFVLFKSLVKYIVGETSMKEEGDTTVLPSKQVQEEEKAKFLSYQEILLRFLHNSSERQAMALYALQVFCHENKFPKGMMLRMFTYLYDLEIVDEEVFLQWKEDIKEPYPGKGKALFQVNQWLTWLEQAESESDED